MSEMQFAFDHEGRQVVPGTVLYVHPSYHWQAGPSGSVERYHGDSVTLRSPTGAVPTVPLSALAWQPHPETVAMEELVRAGFLRPSRRDVSVWMMARRRAADASTAQETAQEAAHKRPGAGDQEAPRATPSAAAAFTQDDCFTLLGHAVHLHGQGQHDMPAFLAQLAERIATSLGDEALARSVRSVLSMHLPDPSAALPDLPAVATAPPVQRGG